MLRYVTLTLERERGASFGRGVIPGETFSVQIGFLIGSAGMLTRTGVTTFELLWLSFCDALRFMFSHKSSFSFREACRYRSFNHRLADCR